MVKHFVTCYFRGIIFSEASIKEIEVRDPQAIVKSLPSDAYGFRFFSIVEKVDEGVTLTSDAFDTSGMYFVNGTVYTKSEVEHMNRKILLDNMKSNGWNHVIETRLGNFQPFLSEDTNIITEA